MDGPQAENRVNGVRDRNGRCGPPTHHTCHRDAPYRIETGGVLTKTGVRRGSHVLTVRPGGRWTLRPGPLDEVGPPIRLRRPNSLVAPALYDAHTHVHPGMEMREFVAHGVTRIRDLGSRIGAGETAPHAQDCADPVPEVVLGGPVLDAPGTPRLRTAVAWTEPDELPARLDDAVHRGASWIKLYSRFPPELFASVARQAHTRGLRVALHPAPGMALSAARAGIDELEHIACLTDAGPGGTHALNRRWAGRRGDESWPMLPVGTRLCPTLVVQHRLVTEAGRNWAFPDADPAMATVWRGMSPATRTWTEWESRDGEAATAAMDAAVVRLAQQGVHLVVGSDSPNPGVLPGAGLWEELNLLVAAGLPPVSVYLSASVTGTGLGDSGSESLTLLPLWAFHEFESTGRYEVARVSATLVRGCLFTMPHRATSVRDLVREER